MNLRAPDPSIILGQEYWEGWPGGGLHPSLSELLAVWSLDMGHFHPDYYLERYMELSKFYRFYFVFLC